MKPFTLCTTEVSLFGSVDKRELARQLDRVQAQAIRKRIKDGFVTTKIADPALAESSSAVDYMLKEIAVVRLAKKTVQTLQTRDDDGFAKKGSK
jgi:hypothetical protein